MFDTRIVNSDPYLDMPASSQALYFHLGMQADDEGFVYPKRVMRSVNASEDDLKVLISKKFIVPFESGVVVVKHWHVNNALRRDRTRNTTHTEHRQQLHLDSSGVYHVVDNHDAALRLLKEVSKEVSKGQILKENTGELTEEEQLQRTRQIANKLRGVAADKRI